MILCPECGAGQHAHCIEQGCECECVLLSSIFPIESACIHGLVRSMCEQCEQEEQ